MTLDEAIEYAEEVAEINQAIAYNTDDDNWMDIAQCEKCAEEHRQLAEWLKELKDYRARIPSYEAGYNDAKREIALSGEYERAYKRGKSDAEQAQWIPVSEGLPEVGEKVLCQCQANIYEVLKLTVGGWYHDERHCYMSGFVIAWTPLPEPYKAESEENE